RANKDLGGFQVSRASRVNRVNRAGMERMGRLAQSDHRVPKAMQVHREPQERPERMALTASPDPKEIPGRGDQEDTPAPKVHKAIRPQLPPLPPCSGRWRTSRMEGGYRSTMMTTTMA